MRFLSVAGTAAMFLVGGSIIGHGIPAVHHVSEALIASVLNLPAIGGILKVVAPMLIDALVGLAVGAACVAVIMFAQKLMPKKQT